MTMIERAARALFTIEHGDDASFEAWPVIANEMAVRARAVLQAIREPSEAMEGAGREALEDGAELIVDGDATACWHAMIDAALAE